MNDMIGSLLSDPESLRQIKELADMLGTELSGKGGEGSAEGGSSSGTDALSGLMGLLGGDSGIDIGTVMQLGEVISRSGENDKDRELLMALRPHLCEERQQKLDRAVKMLRLWSVFTALKESGLLGKLGDMNLF